MWELLSLGLSLSFSVLLAEKKVKPVARALAKSLKGHFKHPQLGTYGPDAYDNIALTYNDIVSLLRAALKYQPDKIGLDPVPVRIAEILIVDRNTQEFVRRLVNRHCIIKQGDAWVDLIADKVRDCMPNKSLPYRVEPRTYRIDAFRQLLRDLGKSN